MSNKLKVLRAFVEEFSPMHRGKVENFSYDELFEVVEDIVDEHWHR